MYFFSLRRITRASVLVFGANATARADRFAQVCRHWKPSPSVHLDVGRLSGKKTFIDELHTLCKKKSS